MIRSRAPRLVGVAGGVGTSTLAAALRGHDHGTDPGSGVDVLVCRATGQSLHQAAITVNWLAAAGQPRPVLAVTADQPGGLRAPARARLRMIEPRVAGLTVLPAVEHWRDVTDPLSEAARLAQHGPAQLPRALRGYAGALSRLARQVLDAGLLGQTSAREFADVPAAPCGAVPEFVTAPASSRVPPPRQDQARWPTGQPDLDAHRSALAGYLTAPILGGPVAS